MDTVWSCQTMNNTIDELKQIIIEKDKLLNEHKRNSIWTNFLLDNYRKSHRIVPNRPPTTGDQCYRCGKRFVYSYRKSKQWYVFESNIVSCAACMPSQLWLDKVIDVCENKRVAYPCSSSSSPPVEHESNFSVTSRWLVKYLDGEHTYYCTES